MPAVTPSGQEYHGEGTHLAELLWSVIAFAGGLAKYLYEMNKNKSPFKLVELLAKVVVSIFSGFTGGSIAKSIGLSPDAAVAIVALSGWLGADAIEAFWKFVQKKYLP